MDELKNQLPKEEIVIRQTESLEHSQVSLTEAVAKLDTFAENLSQQLELNKDLLKKRDQASDSLYQEISAQVKNAQESLQKVFESIPFDQFNNSLQGLQSSFVKSYAGLQNQNVRIESSLKDLSEKLSLLEHLKSVAELLSNFIQNDNQRASFKQLEESFAEVPKILGQYQNSWGVALSGVVDLMSKRNEDNISFIDERLVKLHNALSNVVGVGGGAVGVTNLLNPHPVVIKEFLVSDPTLSGIKAQIDRLTFEGDDLNVNATLSVTGVVVNTTTSVSGQRPMAQSQSVVLASDHNIIAISGTVHQGTGGASPWLVKPRNDSRSDTYTTVTTGVMVDASTNPVKCFAIQVKGTGAVATSWEVRLEGSLDSINFTSILQHTNTTGDGEILYSGPSLFPSLYFRSRVQSLSLGSATNIVVTILGAG